MIWLPISIILGLFALVLLLCGLMMFIEGPAPDDGRWFAIGLLVMLVVGLGCVFGSVKSTVAFSRDLGQRSCSSFANQTDYDTRYLITTWIDSGECFVMFDGNLVPKDQLWAELGGER